MALGAVKKAISTIIWGTDGFMNTPRVNPQGITTSYVVPGGATFYITNGVIMKVQ